MKRSVRRVMVAASSALVAFGLLGARDASAETRRVAVVVGHNTGDVSERPLRYAEDDAGKLADVLVELGDVDRSRLFVVRGKPREAVVEALTRAAATVKAARLAPDDRVVLTFFYSGHSDASALQLGASRLLYSELKRLLDATGAEVRLTIVDGCKSGGLVATKGGKPAPAFEIGLRDQLTSAGEATLTSSAADEASLESSEIRGSFFTHHLVSGLRGAADSSGDGRVTLSEAYEYAFNRTVVASAATGSAPQHPNYDYQLTGGGELVLTRVGERSASLRLPAGFGRALVTNVLRDQVVAELTRDEVRVLAVAPGDYAVRLWKGSETFVGRVKAKAGGATEVSWEMLAAASAIQGSAAKGAMDSFDGGDRFGQPTDQALPPAAQEQYDAAMLSVGEEMVVTELGGSPTLTSSDKLYLGRYRKEISAKRFLGLVGRDDLVKKMEAQRTKRLAVAGIGGAIVLGSLAYLVTSDHSPQDNENKLAVAGVITGVVVWFLSAAVDNGVPKSHQLREMADRHNRDLRAKLRGEPTVEAKPISARLELKLAPVVTPSGGGLTLVGRF